MKMFFLSNYKGHFGLKWQAEPYRSGYDRNLLTYYLNKYGFSVEFVRMADVDFQRQEWQGKIVLYTSSEEFDSGYKQYIEDVVYGLELAGANVLPNFCFLRAHNNKVFMEILRDLRLGKELSGLTSQFFGTLEELERAIDNQQIEFPCVIKSATGAMSRGVAKAENRSELFEFAQRISRTPHYYHEIKEIIRAKRMRGYSMESRFQKKFIIQPFIPNLTNDWKVLIYGDQYYVLKRHVRPNDFRASGSHVDYKSGLDAGFPAHMFDYLEKVFEKLDSPFMSLDFGYDGNRGYIFEFQSVHYGTSTQYLCSDCFIKRGREWVTEKKKFDQEEVFIWALAKYFEKHGFPVG